MTHVGQIWARRIAVITAVLLIFVAQAVRAGHIDDNNGKVESHALCELCIVQGQLDGGDIPATILEPEAPASGLECEFGPEPSEYRSVSSDYSSRAPPLVNSVL